MLTPIIILMLLSTPLIVAYIGSRFGSLAFNQHKYACWGLGLAFVFFSIGHVIKTSGMVEMLPPVIPFKEVLIYFTGGIELLVGLALFKPHLQKIASQSAIVIFVLFFPANVYAALNSVGLGGHQWGPEYLLIRIPLQIILISWAYFLCIAPLNKK